MRLFSNFFTHSNLHRTKFFLNNLNPIGHSKIVEFLLEQTHISVDTPISGSVRVLLEGADKRSQQGTLKQFLLTQYGNDLPERISGITPFHIAVLFGNASIVDLLLKAGANADSPILGIKPLEFAKKLGYEEIVKVINEKKVSVEQTLHQQQESTFQINPY